MQSFSNKKYEIEKNSISTDGIGYISDGVTTALECEVGAYPVDVYYNNLKGKSQVNYGVTVSVAGIREKVKKVVFPGKPVSRPKTD